MLTMAMRRLGLLLFIVGANSVCSAVMPLTLSTMVAAASVKGFIIFRPLMTMIMQILRKKRANTSKEEKTHERPQNTRSSGV